MIKRKPQRKKKVALPPLTQEDIDNALRVRLMFNALSYLFDRLPDTFLWQKELKNRTNSYLSFFDKQVLKLTRGLTEEESESFMSAVEEIVEFIDDYKNKVK